MVGYSEKQRGKSFIAYRHSLLLSIYSLWMIDNDFCHDIRVIDLLLQ